MNLTLLKSKIHRAEVTQAELNYVGSITIDETLMKAANMLEYEKVLISNINSGARLETYIIKGKADSGVICLNGSAARLVQKGDKIIIMAFCQLPEEIAKKHNPIVVLVKEDNKIDKIISKEEANKIYK